ncbi:uncharacterized protein LOC116172214 isoform X1 [Photinus pyralis]|uniref:uncharacterized protein LOC116172214 isoform X1 n=1 Tax=Photinus pyralis TaxID=7054 RepID=UPI0012671808|nr:uncharacterized protein LOC116172214 isoform X1 [Photinus pyralis]
MEIIYYIKQMIAMRAVLCLLVCLVLVAATPATLHNNNDEKTYLRNCYGFECPKGTVTCSVDSVATDDWMTDTIRCKSKNHAVLNSFTKTYPLPNCDDRTTTNCRIVK